MTTTPGHGLTFECRECGFLWSAAEPSSADKSAKA